MFAERMDGSLIPRDFFVTSGIAHEAASELHALDLALMEAGIGDLNLVSVSSILPSGARESAPITLPKGGITFCVMVKMIGNSGERLGCGLAWAMGTTKDGERYGLVAEYHGSELKGDIDSIVRAEIMSMAEARYMVLDEVRTRVESMICKGNHGCVVSALVFY
jgi:arginine decarboxylase